MTITHPLTTGTATISVGSYNDVFELVNEVIGVGEDGYGLQDFFSTPVSTGTVITAAQWKNLYIDLVERAYQHITSSTNTLTTAITTGSTVIQANYQDQAWITANYVYNNRYTCAEGQYFRDPNTNATVNYTGGITTRTLEWGVFENNIYQTTIMRWGSRLLARYFFNLGGYVTWTPFHNNIGYNDIDSEWAQFIVAIQQDQVTSPIKYDRAAFIAQNAGTTATVYPVGSTRGGTQPSYESGNLSINVQIFKATNEESLRITTTFSNSDGSLLIVTPTVGYWNEVV
jgi:hypothetical protein